MDDTRTRDARTGRPRRELPESLAWLYEQPADERPPSRDAEPVAAPSLPLAPVPAATVPAAPGRAPTDPEALPTLLPFSPLQDEPRASEQVPGPFPAGALLVPSDHPGPIAEPTDTPSARSASAEPIERAEWAEPARRFEPARWAQPEPPSAYAPPSPYAPARPAPDAPVWRPAPEPQEPPALRPLFDTPRFAQPAPRPIPAGDWPATSEADDWFRPAQQQAVEDEAPDVDEARQVADEAPDVDTERRDVHDEASDANEARYVDAAALDVAEAAEAPDLVDGPDVVDVVDVPEPEPADERAEKPAPQQSVDAQADVDEADVHEPVVDEADVHEPAIDEHDLQEPVVDEGDLQEPAVDEAELQEPAADEADLHAPVTDEADLHQPVVDEPAGGPAPVVPPRPELGDPALGPVWTAVREALQSTADTSTAVDVRGLDREGRRALAGLLSVPAVRAATRVDLTELEAAVMAAGGTSLAVAAERFVPLGTGRRARTQTRTAAVRAGQEWLEAHPAMAALPWTGTWLETIRRDTVSGDAGLTPHEVTSALAVLESLTTATAAGESGWRLRAEVASQVADDEHALDDGSAVAALVLRGLAAAAGTALPTDPAGRRRLWGRYGVLPDLVSASCVAVGVAPADDACGRRWRLAALDGVPVHVTARDVRATGAWVPVDEAWPAVLVVDSPRALETIAERFGGRVPAVWVDGTGDVLALDLVARLFESGTAVRFVADFDQPGLALGSLLAARFGATPWRMTADVYRGSVRSDLPALAGRVTDPEWAPELGTAMAQAGRAVPVEQVLDDLLAGLALEVGSAQVPASA